MTERRYDEGEAAEILEQASVSESKVAAVPTSVATGLTLAQLQEIGSEVGIAPSRVADAARAVASRGVALPPRTFLGAPRSVSRVVAIPRALTDDEWMRLVVDLRETFGAVGKLSQHGSLRSWNNGNLQVHVEPEGDHYRVRMRTLKGDVFPRVFVGSAFVVMGAIAAFPSILSSPDPEALFIAAMFGAIGLGQIAWSRASLPRWADERAAQMEALATRIPLLLVEPITENG